MGFDPADLNLNIEEALQDDVVVAWSGGPDSPGLIRLLLENYPYEVHPIFVNRHQTNYPCEKEAIIYYKKFFPTIGYRDFRTATHFGNSRTLCKT